MNHWLNAARWLLIAFLVYVAAFMKEEQEGKWENTLQSWLDKIYLHQEGSYAKVTALARAVSRLSELVTEKLFGGRLLSLRSFLVSAYLGISSFFLMGLLTPWITRLTPQLPHATPPTILPLPMSRWDHVLNFVQFVSFFIAGIIPAVLGENEQEAPWIWRMWKYGLLVLIFRYAFSIFWVFRLRSAFQFVLFIGLLFSFNFLWDILFIKATRWMLRIASNTRQLAGVLVTIVLDALLGTTILIGPMAVALYVLVKSNGSLIGAGLFFGVALKLIDFIIAFLVLILLTFIGIHVMVWFALERPISNCLRFKLIRDKKLIWFLAGALYAAPHIGFLGALLK